VGERKSCLIRDENKENRREQTRTDENRGEQFVFGERRVQPSLCDNDNIVLAAVQNYGRALDNASERLKDDPEIVLAAAQGDGFALQCASERLKDPAPKRLKEQQRSDRSASPR
jgi:hypothetical protein